uniref:Pecanex-like protein n=1 Tax=Rodentolepis nana TaxID=102285 RepID=A0A0R3T6S3_RODNA
LGTVQKAALRFWGSLYYWYGGALFIDPNRVIYASHTYAYRLLFTLVSVRRLSPEPSGEGKGIRRRVLATTSQRIRHWHPDIYEDIGNAGSGVVIGRSKSSPNHVFHRASVAKKEPTSPQFALPLVASARSSLNTSTITTTTNNNSRLPMSVSPKKEAIEGVEDEQSGILINFPPSASPTTHSEEDSSSISEHDVLLVPTILRSQNCKSPSLSITIA